MSVLVRSILPFIHSHNLQYGGLFLLCDGFSKLTEVVVMSVKTACVLIICR
jgi:hypothetical protein